MNAAEKQILIERHIDAELAQAKKTILDRWSRGITRGDQVSVILTFYPLAIEQFCRAQA